MRLKTFYLLAATLMILAIITNILSMSQYSAATQGVARMHQIAQESRSEHQAIIDNHHYNGYLFQLLSYAFSLSGIVFWAISAARKERCGHSILIVLFSAIMLLQFILV